MLLPRQLISCIDWRRTCGGITILSLAMVATLASPKGSVPISDAVMNEVRGTNPGLRKVSKGSCTTENVNNLNTFDPPGGPPTAVAFSNCASGLNGTSICISCVIGQNVFELMGGGTPPGYDTEQTHAINCGDADAGIQGTCMLDSAGNPYCGNQVAFSCSTYGIDYERQVDDA